MTNVLLNWLVDSLDLWHINYCLDIKQSDGEAPVMLAL